MSRYIDADELHERLQALVLDERNKTTYTTWSNAFAEIADMVEYDIPNMALEELKEEAKKKGYKLIKDVPYLKLMPCVCGSHRRTHWKGLRGHQFTCDKCGLASEWGKSERKTRELWNEMIIRLTKEKEVSNDD